MAPSDSLLSLTLNCPALGVQSSWVLRLNGSDGEELQQCIQDFRQTLRAKNLIALEKEGEMSSAQEMLMEGLLFQRLKDWQEKLRRCQQIEEDKQNWESKLQRIRVDYIREIEMYRLKLRDYEAGRVPQDQRKSSMSRLREEAVQTDMQSPLPEIVSLWEKSLDLQHRLDVVFRRNMAFEKVEDCIFLLQRAVLEDQNHTAALEKALLDTMEALSRHTLALHEAKQLALLALDGRDVTAIQRKDLIATEPREVLRLELREAISEDTLEALEAIVKGEDECKTEQLVLKLRGMVRSLQDLQDENTKTARKKDSGLPPCYVTHVLGVSEAPDAPPLHPHVTVIRDALSSAKVLNETLEMVKAVSLKKAGVVSANLSASLASPVSPSSGSPLRESVAEEVLGNSPSLHQDNADLASFVAPSEVFSDVLVSEHIFEGQASANVEEELDRLPDPFAAFAAASQDVMVEELPTMVADASTMTPSHLLLSSLLKSKDVRWTAVPLGSEKNFQWSLMPALAEHSEAGDIEGGLRRMEAMLQKAELPSKVLAGHAPGIHWPSISPMAWSKIGGGLDLARITADPYGLSGGVAAVQRARGQRVPAGSCCEKVDWSEVLDLQPTTSSVTFCESRKQVRVSSRAGPRRPRTAPRQNTKESMTQAADPAALAEVFLSQVPEVTVAPGAGARVATRRYRTEREREQDDQVVQEWLARLRAPLPAVSKFEGQEPRHATSLVSVMSDVPESCRRFSHESMASEAHIYLDDAFTDDAGTSRPSSATPCGTSRPSSAATPHGRPLTGRRVQMSKVMSVAGDDVDEAPSERIPAMQDTWQLPRAPAFVPRTPLRRVPRRKAAPKGGGTRLETKRPATAERQVHRAYVCQRPASAMT